MINLIVFSTISILFSLTSPALAGDYVVIAEEATVDATAEAAWAKVGDYCAIEIWMGLKCEITSGNGGTGTVRLLNGEIEEVIVGSTANSHTYMQTKGSMKTTGYHGTVSVSANKDGKSSTLRWIAVYDQSALPDDATRAATREQFGGFYQNGVASMKTLAEGE